MPGHVVARGHHMKQYTVGRERERGRGRGRAIRERERGRGRETERERERIERERDFTSAIQCQSACKHIHNEQRSTNEH